MALTTLINEVFTLFLYFSNRYDSKDNFSLDIEQNPEEETEEKYGKLIY